MGERARKRKIETLLAADDFESSLAEIKKMAPAKAVGPLIGRLCSTDELIKWRAVTTLGIVVTAMADHEMEDARIVMRRFMWMLNDESGGIGWGVPEAFAEVISCHSGLADEYAHILVSFMREDGFYLEYQPLQRGLMWGVGRFATIRPDLLHKFKAVKYLLPYQDSSDETVKKLAVRALKILASPQAAST